MDSTIVRILAKTPSKMKHINYCITCECQSFTGHANSRWTITFEHYFRETNTITYHLLIIILKVNNYSSTAFYESPPNFLFNILFKDNHGEI